MYERLSVLILFLLFCYILITSVKNFIYYYTLIKANEKDFKYDEYLERLDFYKNLTNLQKNKLKRYILIMLDTKEFIGDYSTQMKIEILAYASLLILNQKDSDVYKSVDSIIIKNHTLLKDEKKDYSGIRTEYISQIEGLSSDGVVVLSYPKIKKDIKAHSKDNLVIHEFAHQLDLQNGLMNGTPILEDSLYSEWAKVLSKEYTRLKEKTLKNRFLGNYSFLGRYASTNEAEFFAVCSELYFQKPKELYRHFSDIYIELNKYYKLNTKEWNY